MTGAVITADIVNSTRLSKSESKKLMKVLGTILQPHLHEFFRGDSFQVMVQSPAEALSLVLQARMAAMKLLSEGATPIADIRASIGIGTIRQKAAILRTATSEAFILSGRCFDSMEKEQRLSMITGEKNGAVNAGLRLISHFIDYLFRRLTVKQATVVFELLVNRTQVETAKRLKKSQVTIHKHLQAAGWPEIEKLIVEYKKLIEFIEP
jgi:hypothetical protein